METYYIVSVPGMPTWRREFTDLAEAQKYYQGAAEHYRWKGVTLTKAERKTARQWRLEHSLLSDWRFEAPRDWEPDPLLKEHLLRGIGIHIIEV